ncbi:hypothetical protein RV13_GL000430 [Enterococcus raffinosus]|nr:hypothetical protein RV13_GL000430 [Enterococcus raffinosus]
MYLRNEIKSFSTTKKSRPLTATKGNGYFFVRCEYERSG